MLCRITDEKPADFSAGLEQPRLTKEERKSEIIAELGSSLAVEAFSEMSVNDPPFDHMALINYVRIINAPPEKKDEAYLAMGRDMFACLDHYVTKLAAR